MKLNNWSANAVIYILAPLCIIAGLWWLWLFSSPFFCDFITDLYKCPETDVGRRREGQADRHSNRSVSDRKRPVSPI